MARQPLALVDVLAQIEDFRQASGRRYSLPAILSLAVAAMLCGFKSYSAMAEWGRLYGCALALALGFTDGKTPCAATFFNVFGGLDKLAFEQRLTAWAESLLDAHAAGDDLAQATALDGKTLRGSRQQGAPAAHLLAAVGHRLGVTLYQREVADPTNELGAVEALLAGLLLPGKVLTMDALLTQEGVARQIVAAGAD